MGGGTRSLGTVATGRKAVAVASFLLFLGFSGLAASSSVSAIEDDVAAGSQVFTFQGDGSQPFTVPAGVYFLTVDMRGGWGGGNYDNVAAPGKGGEVDTVLPVSPGMQLGVWVGRYGANEGGPGWAHGGDHGAAWGPSVSHSGDGGGGASAITNSLGQVIVVAGGGGGAGGDDENHAWGGAGGDGGNPAQKGTDADGQGGKLNDEGRVGGCGGCRSESDGDSGEGTDFGEVVGGGGGGGGGGYNGGAGGDNGVYRFEQVDNIGGSGGGGGLSWVGGFGLNTKYSVSSSNCPGGDTTDAACNGQVTLSWGQPAAGIAVYSGGGQVAQVDSELAPISALVTDSAGIPVPGAPVTFTLPATGPSGLFPNGGTTLDVTTGPMGVATVPRLRANSVTGGWTAKATVPGAGQTAKFTMTNQPAPTRTIVTSNPNPSIYRDPVRIEAYVASGSPNLIPTGDVQFSVDGDPAGPPVPVNSFGRSVLPTDQVPVLDVGSRDLGAEYLGDDAHVGSSGSRTQTVNRIPTAVSLASDPNPSDAGESVNLLVTVSPAGNPGIVPTGLVEFREGGDPLGTQSLDANGQAEIATTALPLGATEVTAAYAGDPDFQGSSGRVMQSVGPEATATQISASANPSVYREGITWTAAVRRTDQGAALAGTISFELDGDPVCAPAEVDAQGEVTCSPASPPGAGVHSVEADYDPPAGSGDLPSRGVLDQVVLEAPSLTEPSVTPEPSAFGEPATLRAVVTLPGSPGFSPSGTVSISVNGQNVAPAIPLDNGVAATPENCQIPPAPCPFTPGGHLVEAEFAPGGGDTQPSHAVIRHRVTSAPTSVTVISGENPAPADEPVAFTANVTAAASAGAPTGPVQFLVDGQATGEAVAVRGGKQAVSLPVEMAQGEHLVTARFIGSANFSPSSGDLTQEVGPPDPNLGTPRLQFLGRRVKITRRGSLILRARCYGPGGTWCRARSVIRSRQVVRMSRRKSRRGWVRVRPGKALALRNVNVRAGRTARLKFDLTNDGIRIFVRMKGVASQVSATPEPGTALMKPYRVRILSHPKLRLPKPERIRGRTG